MPEDKDLPIGFDPSKQLSYLQGNNKPTDLGTQPVKAMGLAAPTYGESKYDIPDQTSEQDLETGDYNYRRGERQSNLEKWGVGIGKAVSKLGVRTVNGIVSPLYGIGSAVANWDVSKLWDNEISEITSNIEKSIDDEFGLYSTKAAEDAKGFSKMAHVNFWANDVLDGMSYSAAAMASGSVWAKALKGVGTLAMAGKAKVGTLLGEAATTIDNATDQVKYVTDLDSKVRRLKNGLNNGAVAALGASTEASVEAYNGANEWEKKMIEQISTNPDGSHRTPTEGELAYIKQLRKSVGNSQYAINLPIIMASNWVTFGKAMMGSKSAEKLTAKEIGERIAREGVDQPYKKATLSSVQKMLDATYGTRKFLGKALPEGAEEWEQFATGKGTDDFYTKRYYNPESATFAESMSAGINAAMTEEGLEQFLVGAVSGGIFGNATHVAKEGLKGYKNPYNDAVMNDALDYINSIKGKDAYKETLGMLNRHANIAEELDKHLSKSIEAGVAKSKEFEIGNDRSNLLINYVNHMINMGKTADLKEDLESYRNLSPEEFEQVLGLKLDTDKATGLKETVHGYIQKRLDKINKIEKLSDSIDELHPNLARNIKDRFMYAAWTIEDARDRASQLNKEINNILSDEADIIAQDSEMFDIGENTPNAYHLWYDVNKGLINNYIELDAKTRKKFNESLEKAPLTPMNKALIKTKAEDLDKLIKRRKEFALEYKALTDPLHQVLLSALDKQAEEKASDIIAEETIKDEAAKKVAKMSTQEQEQHLTDLLQQVTTTEDHFELQNIAKEAALNPLITAEQKEFLQKRYEEIVPTSIRKQQVERQITALEAKAKEVTGALIGINRDIAVQEREANEIIEDFYKGNIAMSAKKFEKKLAELTKVIDSLEKTKNDLEEQLKSIDASIQDKKEDLSNKPNIEDVKAERKEKAEDYKRVEEEIDTTKKQISKLRKLYNDLVKIFKSLYPNYESELIKGRAKVVEGQKELDATKLETTEAIKQLKTKLNDLTSELENIAEQGRELTAEIEEFNKLLVTTRGNVFAFVNATEQKVSAEGNFNAENSNKAITQYDPKAKKDIREALFTTAGNNMVGETDNVTKDEDQQRWFNYTSGMSLTKKSNYTLRAITQKNNPFGNSIKFFDAETIMLVLHKDGDPVLVDGNMIFTSMRKNIEGTNDVILTTINSKFTNKDNLTNEHLLSINEHLKKVRDAIFSSKEPVVLKVNGKSRGIYIKDNTTTVDGKPIFKFPVVGRIKETAAEIDDVIVVVAKENKTVVGKYVVSTTPGVVLIAHNHNILQGRVSKLGEIPGATKKAIELIKELMAIHTNEKDPNYTGKLAKEVFDELNTLTLFGNYNNNSKHKIFLSKDGFLFFGGKLHSSINDLELEEFLNNKYFRINGALLEKNEPIKDPITGKEYSSYKQYIMSSEGRTASSVPLGVGIVPLGTQQFYNVGLQFSHEGLGTPIDTVVVDSSKQTTTDKTAKTNSSSAVQILTPAQIANQKNTELVLAYHMNAISAQDFVTELAKRKIDASSPIAFKTYQEALESLGGVVETPEVIEPAIEETSNLLAGAIMQDPEEEVGSATVTSVPTKEQSNGLQDILDNLPKSDKNPNDWKKLYEVEEPATKEQLAAEEKWFKANFPQIPYERVKGLIDSDAMGIFLKSGKVLISELAATGTTYHEAFHVVSQLFLTPQELKNLYSEYRKRSGKDLTDREVEEALADDFMSFMLGITQSIAPIQKSLFRKILDFVKSLLGITNNNTIDNIFSNIKKGAYKTKPILNTPTLDLKKALPGKDSAWTRDILESTTTYFFKHLMKIDSNNSIENLFDTANKGMFKDIYDKVFNDIFTQYKLIQSAAPEAANELAADYVYINKNWNLIKLEHTKYLKRFGVEVTLKDNGIVENKEEGNKTDVDNRKDFEDTVDETERVRDTTYIDTIQFSSKDNSPKTIKLLVASLPLMKYVNGDLKVVVNRFGLPKSTEYGSTFNYLHNNLANLQSYSDMVSKLDVMKLVKPELNILLSYLKTSVENPTPVTLSDSQFKLQRQFFQQFAKTMNTYLTTMIDKDGNIYSFDANSSKLGDVIKEAWMNNVKNRYNDPNGIYTANNGILELNKQRVSNLYKQIKDNDLATYLEFLNKLGITFSTSQFTDEEEAKIKAFTIKLNEYVLKDNKVSSLFQKGAVTTILNDIVNIEASYNKEAVELQHINPEGKSVYGVTLNTYLSLVVNEFNNNPEKSDKLDLTKNKFATNSLFRELILKGKKIKLNVAEGLKANIPGVDGKLTSDLSKADLMLQHVNLVLANRFPFMRAGDKRLEYVFEIELAIKDINVFKERMLLYYKDELDRIAELQQGGLGSDIEYYKTNGLKSLMFEGITSITDKFNSNKTTADKFIAKNKQQLSTDIEKYIASRINALKSELEDYGLIVPAKEDTFILKGLDKSVVSSYLGNKESYTQRELYILLQQAVMKNFVATVEQTKLIIGDISYYKAGGDLHKRTGGLTGPKKVTDTDPSTNEWMDVNRKRTDGKLHNGKINSIVYDDVIASSEYLEEYLKNFPASQRAIILEAYSKINETDAQGYITLDEYREFMDRSGEWTPQHEKAYQKAIKGHFLKPEDFQYFMPLKPQYFGNQEYTDLYVPTYLKLSLIPLVPSVIKGRQIATLADLMKGKQIGIATFRSATKVGYISRDNTPTNFYSEDGTINKELPVIQVLDYKYLGIQVDIAPINKSKVTFGTQFRKLILANLFKAGKSKDITIFRGKKPTVVSSESLVNEYSDVINQLTKIKRDKLVKELTLEKDNNNNYKIKDFNVFKKVLLSEAESRDSVDNVIESIELALTSENKILDGTLAKNKLEQVLFSIINNNVISQKVAGDMKVQASSAGFELEARKFKDISKEDKAGIQWIGNSQTLKFYRKGANSSTLDMEILVPHYFKEMLGDIDIQSLDSEHQRDLLNIIGFRTPTQGLNSIESIKIVGFLPKESGNLVIVPSEITAKGGSDFDIDKLTIFYRNYVMVNGQPYTLPSSTSIEDLRGLYNYIKENTTKWDVTLEAFYESNLEKILQNKVIDLSRDILKAPENYNNLLYPNTTVTLKNLVEDIRNILGKEAANKKGTEAFDIIHNVNTATAFWVGKAGVAVSAIHNTHHILSQIADLAIKDPDTFINFAHNINESGAISLAGEKDNDGVNTISDMISQFINAYVDIAKDPFIFDMNAGIQTANVWFYLLRAGVHIKNIGYFMRQPIIWDYIKAQSINESSYKEATDSVDSKRALLKKLYKKYQPNANIKATTNVVYTNEQMIKFLGDHSAKKKLENDFYNAQLQFLNDFVHYQDTAKQLSELVAGTSPDTKGLGKNRNASRQVVKKIESVMSGDLSKFFINGNKIIENTLIREFSATIREGNKFFNDLFITETPKIRENVLDKIEEVFDTRDYTANTIEELMDVVENEFINFALQNGEINNVRLNNDLNKLFFGPNSLANKVAAIKQLNGPLAQNLLIKNLFPIINTNRTKQDNIKFFSKKMNTYDLNTLTDAYTELYNTNPALADDLTKLAIMQSGIGNSPINFINVVPADKFFKIANSIVTNIMESDSFDISKFNDLFYQNNTSNNKIVRRLSSKSIGTEKAMKLSNGNLMLSKENYLINDPYIKVISIKQGLDNNQEAIKQTLARGESIYDIRLYKNIDGGEFELTPIKGDGYKQKDYRTTLAAPVEQVFKGNAGKETVIKDLVSTEKNSTFTERELSMTEKRGLFMAAATAQSNLGFSNEEAVVITSTILEAKTTADLDSIKQYLIEVNGLITFKTTKCK